MKPNQTSVSGGIENILVPMEYFKCTQGDFEGNHPYYACDMAGRDAGRDLAYFSFSARCVAIDTPANGNAVFWESLNKVRFADGTIDYCVIMVIHDNSTAGISKGVTYKQGQQMAQEGTAGFATGNHLHIEIAKGKFTTMYAKNAKGYYLPNGQPIEKCCFADGTTFLNSENWNWKYTSKEKPPVEKPQVETHKICYRVHVKDNGWLAPVYDGKTAGTTGQGKRVEALKIDPLGLDIEVKAHIQNIGWKDYGKITRDTVIGTTGEQKRLEAICIKCANLMYRVHIAGSGWSAWTMADGINTLGTVGMEKAIEAIEMKII